MINEIINKIRGEKDVLISNLPYQLQILVTIFYNYMNETESLEITQKTILGEIKKMCELLSMKYSNEILEGLK